jgi:hypothetical protein
MLRMPVPMTEIQRVRSTSCISKEWGWHDLTFVKKLSILKSTTNYTGCPKNGVLTVHYGVEEISMSEKVIRTFVIGA